MQSIIRHLWRGDICWNCLMFQAKADQGPGLPAGSLQSRGERQHLLLWLWLCGRHSKVLWSNTRLKNSVELIVVFNSSQLLQIHFVLYLTAKTQFYHMMPKHLVRTPQPRCPPPTEMMDFRYPAIGDIKGTYIVRQKREPAHHRLPGRPVVRWNAQPWLQKAEAAGNHFSNQLLRWTTEIVKACESHSIH